MGEETCGEGEMKLEEDCGRPDLRVIAADTLAAVLATEIRFPVLLVDARFEYEYDGGHIRGAVNTPTPEDLRRLSLSLPESTRLIFHCEFSECRAPALCRWFRNEDRKANAENFPRLRFPHLYLLKGGYAAFYAQFPALCEPCGYVKMKDEGRKRERKEGLARVRKGYGRFV
jgi:rhodanese-related sulfurtransferase